MVIFCEIKFLGINVALCDSVHNVKTIHGLYEPRVRKPDFCICKNKDADQLRDTAKLISAFVFATRIVQSLYFLNPKFQASRHFL